MLTYGAQLTGAAEAPPNASRGTGSALVTIDTVLASMVVQFNFAGLSGTTTAAHIHCCTAVPGAGTVGVASVTPNFTGFVLGVSAGSYFETYNLLAPVGT